MNVKIIKTTAVPKHHDEAGIILHCRCQTSATRRPWFRIQRVELSFSLTHKGNFSLVPSIKSNVLSHGPTPRRLINHLRQGLEILSPECS